MFILTLNVFIPDDHTRVRLRSKGSNNDEVEKSEDYLNANFVDGFRQPRAYIATQGPSQGTFSAFWKMVWEQNTQVIVMITHLFENGKVSQQSTGIRRKILPLTFNFRLS